jgi:hypothetical protein
MAVPALVIGLGGTGQWVLTYLKKDLVETYGRIPVGVRLRAFDTVKIARAQAGGQVAEEGQERVEERAVGSVRLEPGEYIHLGGYVRDYVKDIAYDEENERFPHLRSWFQARYYLDNLPDQQFNLDEGAGQFRQFGRLAVFHDLKAPTMARMYGQLQDTVQQIQRETNTQNLYVFVVGSLAGGTGAGMFVDVAHLVRQIAREQAHMEVNVRGFLVLPDAFGALPAGNVVKRGMNARAFAAMRENKRFSINFDWDLGYPMHYQALVAGRPPDPVLRGAIKGQLFDHLYYLDGHRTNFPLFSIPLEHGVAPTVSDMISAILDSKSSGTFEEHTRNLQAVLAARGGAHRVPYYGSVGTYSIAFPIYHVIESYAHRLGLEALLQLLQPAVTDSRTGIPTRLAGNRNREAGEGYTGADAARALLTCSSIVDPSDPTRAVDNTLLTADLVDVAEKYTPQDASIVDQLANRSLADWDRVFAPTGQSEDVLNARQRAEAVLNVKLETEVPPSQKVTPREKPSDGMYRIENGVRSHKNIYLGAEQPETGQRVGGKYREALGEYANVHLNRFQRMLDYKMREILNGRSTTDPILAKGGKLGHLQEFLDALATYLDRSYQVMTKVMERRRSQGYGRMQAIASAQNTLEDMKASANDTRPILGRAHKTQATYLEQEQSLIDIHKIEIVEQAVTDTIKQLADMVATAQASVGSWIATLGVGQGSLYATLLAGRRQVDANRDKDADVESRLVLGARKAGREEDEDYRKFKKYEEERYQHYVHGRQTDQVAAVLGDLSWQVRIEPQRGKPTFKIGLTIGTPSGGQATNALADSPSQNNLKLFLARVRDAFEQVRQDESVLGYLMYAYSSPETLADIIHARSGPLLAHEGTGPIPANYLRVWHGLESAQSDYLTGMLRRLASLSNIADPDRFARRVNSEDRFTCTLVHTLDLVELDRMRAYTNARTEYLGYRGEQSLQTSQRTILHCFPAEVNAVQLEERLGELQQTVRTFDDDIVLQLEKWDNLRLFLFCYAYDLVNIHAFDEAGQSKECYRIRWTPIKERDTGEVWLTKPVKDQEPSFLDAVMTFNYIGKDVGHGPTYFKEIDYDAVRSSLEQRQQEDMKARRAAGTLSKPDSGSDAALKGWLATQEVPENDPVWVLVARHDRLYEVEQDFLAMLPSLAAQLKDNPALQQEYDLASVFVLTLRDEREKLKRRIRSRPREPQPTTTQPTKPVEARKSIWRRN